MTRDPGAERRGSTGFALAILAASLLYLGFHSTRGLDAPFERGFLGHNAARYALAGRNYVRHGSGDVLFAPDLTPGSARAPAEKNLYLHHPPGAPWLVGVSFAAFGIDERSARLPFLLAAWLLPFAVLLLGRRLLDPLGAVAAAAIAALVPMSCWYGAHVDPQGAPVLLSVTLSAFCYARYLSTRDARWIGWTLAVAALGVLFDWSAGYPLGWIAAIEWWRRRPRDGRLVALPAAGLLLLAIHVAWITALRHDVRAMVLDGARYRSAGGLAGLGAAELGAAAAQAASWFVSMHTLPVLALAALAAVPAVRRLAGATRELSRVALMLLAVAVTHVALFPQGALVHDYWTYLFVPPLALLAATAIRGIGNALAGRAGNLAGNAAVALLLGVVAVASWTSLARIAARHPTDSAAGFRALAGLLAAATSPEDRVLSNVPAVNTGGSDKLQHPEFSWYADRIVRGGIEDVPALERALAEESFDRFVHFDRPAAVSPLTAELDARYRRLASRVEGGVQVVVYDLRGAD
jgi:4-amino-4-deoxy-L-arabinose transferase-like glycosyltransferase